MDFYQTLALILKNQWEVFVSDVSETPWSEIVKTRYANIDLQSLKTKFHPDTSIIYQAFEDNEKKAKKLEITPQSFEVLIHEMILADIHLVGIDSPEMKEFIKRTQKSFEMTKNSTKELEQEFQMIKSDWLQSHEELGDLLMLTEQIRLKNAHINREFMIVFGKKYFELKTQSIRYDKIKLKVDLFESMQVSSMKELEQMVADVEANMDREMNNLHMEVFMAPLLSRSQGLPNKIDSDEMLSHHRKCKKILREIWLLAHPDRLMNQKNCENLTESQQQKLKELWNKAMKIRPEEIGFKDWQLGYSCRSDLILEDILASIKTILENIGIDTDIHLIIQGETLNDQISWLKMATEKLEREIETVRAEIKTLIENKDIAKKSALLSSTTYLQEDARKEMIEKSLQLKKEADRLEAYLSSSLDQNTVAQ